MSPTAPFALTIHSLDWQQALLELPASANSQYRDMVVAGWAQRCWQDLCTALPQQRHAVVVHPGQVQERARVYMATEQASGWLYSPLLDAAPRWQANSEDVFLQAARHAAKVGFCAADAVIHGVVAVLSTLDGVDVSSATVWRRRHFPLLGVPRLRDFAPMPAGMLHAGHPYGLYAVMGDADSVLHCIEMGVKLVQLRLKNVGVETLSKQIARCAEAAHQHGALLFINDYWRAAMQHAQHALGIYGVHLGQEDALALTENEIDQLQASGLRLGISSQTLWELARALRLRPSNIACGPIYATATKEIEWPPVGEHHLRLWGHLVHDNVPEQGAPPLPLVAIGGMNVARAQNAAAVAADSVAVVSSITQAANPAQAIIELQRAIAIGRTARDENPDVMRP